MSIIQLSPLQWQCKGDNTDITKGGTFCQPSLFFFLFFSRIRFSNKPKIRMTSEDEWHRVLVKTKQIQLSVKGLALILRAFTSARRPTIRQEINIKYIVSAQWVRELYFLHRFQKGLFKPIYQMSFFFLSYLQST